MKGGPGGMAGGPEVIVSTAYTSEIVDTVEAVGTAFANEQADISSTVTERIEQVYFTDGQRIQKGAVLARLVQNEQSAAQREGQARLTEAQLQLDRLKQLQAKGFATNARVESQQALVDVARASIAASQSRISDRTIRAPFSGWLAMRNVSPGTVVNAGTVIATIVDHSRIKLDFTLPDVHLSALKPGLKIEAKTGAYPGEIFHGTVTSINPMLDPNTRAVTARAIIPNADLRLRPGMLLSINLQSLPREALVVPETSIVGEGTGAFVWKVDAKNEAVRVPVVTGTRRNGQVEILSGLKNGDRLITEGVVKMRGGGPIRPVTPEAFAKSQGNANAAAATLRGKEAETTEAPAAAPAATSGAKPASASAAQ